MTIEIDQFEMYIRVSIIGKKQYVGKWKWETGNLLKHAETFVSKLDERCREVARGLGRCCGVTGTSMLPQIGSGFLGGPLVWTETGQKQQNQETESNHDTRKHLCFFIFCVGFVFFGELSEFI